MLRGFPNISRCLSDRYRCVEVSGRFLDVDVVNFSSQKDLQSCTTNREVQTTMIETSLVNSCGKETSIKDD